MEKVCKTCGQKFTPKNERPNRPAKFCSRKCIRNETQFKKGHKMRFGKKPPPKAWDNPNSKKTRFGAGQPSFFKKGLIPWNKGMDFGGNEYLAKRISWLSKYREWKKLIKERDKYKCVLCGSNKILNVDHYPKSISQLIKEYNVKKPQETKQIKEFWDINNGRTLCLGCHKKTETYGKNIMPKMQRKR